MRSCIRGSAKATLLVTLLVLVAGSWRESALAATPFVNEIADGAVVGSWPSLALDAQGNPHVSYHDNSAANLKYARKSGGVWTIETAEASPNITGLFTSLALDAQGNPHVSYYDDTTTDLKYARKSGGVWTIETAEASANQVGPHTSLALDAQGNPHVSYQDATAGDLKYARRVGGVWTIETADGSANVVGQSSSLALDAQGNPHVAYYDASTTDLKYARKAGGAWTTETAESSASSVGSSASLALDAQGNPHVSYYEGGAAANLKFARKSGGVWTTETADASANNVGFASSLALDAQENPHVTYMDDTTDDVKYARKSGGAWTIETADGSANLVGVYTSLALDAQGNPHVSYHDQTTNDLKYANAAVHLLSPASAVTWPVGSRQDIVWSGIGTVEIALATDGTNFENVLATGIISSPFSIRVPHLPTRFARLRIERASPLSTAVTDSFFTINATIALLKFDATAGADGRSVALAWETAPGPEADVRYRLDRARADADGQPGGAHDFTPLHAGLLDRGEYLDSDAGASARYRLIAVNGLGEEYVLGETAVSAALGAMRLIAYPNPAPQGNTEVLFRVPFDQDLGASGAAIDLAVFDVTGRRVRTLASGELPTGVRAVRWDGRDDEGRRVAAGVYALRLTAGSSYAATQRLTVVH